MAPIALLAQKEIVLENEDLTIDVGKQLQLSAYVTEGGTKTSDEVIFRSRGRKTLYVDSLGIAHAYLPGKVSIIAFSQGVRKNFEMSVNYPPIVEIKIADIPERIYAGTPVQIKYQVIDQAGLVREGAKVQMVASNNNIATVDAFGNSRSFKAGKVNIPSSIEGIQNVITINVVKNPIVKIELEVEGDEARTGDVFHFKARALDAKGREITDAPIRYSFEDLNWLCSIARVPVLMKGVLDHQNAEQGIQEGVGGIIVSNHGGRNLDTAPATVDALPEIVDRVDGRVPVLIDGGIRRGTDVLKALALGAKAVMIGRAYLYGLAANGPEGVSRVLEILQTELEMAMVLTGRPTIASIDRSVLPPGWPWTRRGMCTSSTGATTASTLAGSTSSTRRAISSSA